MWFGGAVDAVCALSGAMLPSIIGTGATVAAMLVGSMTGGALIDRFGLFRLGPSILGVGRLCGLCMVLAGAVAVLFLLEGPVSVRRRETMRRAAFSSRLLC